MFVVATDWVRSSTLYEDMTGPGTSDYMRN